MHTSAVSLVFIVLSTILSVNYGFPHHTLSPNGSTNQEAPLGTSFTSDTPTNERHTLSPPTPSTLNHSENRTTGHIEGDVEVDIENTLANDANNVAESRRPVADISSNDVRNQDDAQSNDNSSTAQDGFPWWSLMLILLATIVIIIAIALPFILYNRRLNQRQAVIKNNKRASEVVVDSWMAASQTSSESVNDEGVIDTENNMTPQSNWGTLTADDGGSRDVILGAS